MATGTGIAFRMPELPDNPRDVVRFSLRERVVFDGLVALARATGVWRYPAPRQGDLEQMKLLDKAYWLYKALYPIERARRGSGLEVFFAEQAGHRWSLPAGFATERELMLSAVGDLSSHAFLERSGETLYVEVADDIFGADVSMANLECRIGFDAREELQIKSRSGPRLVFERASWAAVRGSGERRYDLVATANNHSLDFGAEGVDATLDALDADQIAHHGANRAGELASRVTVIERRGLRLGVLSWTFGLNARRAPLDRPTIVNRAALNAGPQAVDLRLIDAQLRDAQRQRCDFVIAQLHWGMEHERFPLPQQVELAHALAERGVDAIIGHHPHVPQPFEAYRTERDRDRIVPIFYSLGNITTPFGAAHLCHGGLARLRLAKGTGQDGRPRTYVAEGRLEGLRQVVDRSARRLRLLPTGPLNPGGR